MKAAELYKSLENDFIKEGITDLNWAARMPGLKGYLHPGFIESAMGLMCDFAQTIDSVCTAVFLCEKVLTKLLDKGVSNALLFSHHPTNWDIKGQGGNYAAEERLIAKLRERNISIYILHHPLDNYGPFSTCKTLADRLEISAQRPAFLYCGAMCGVIGMVNCADINELSRVYSSAVGHKTSLYLYGEKQIAGGRVALCPGGGNALFVLEEMIKNGVRTLITGVTILNDYSRSAHEFAKKNGVNLLGGTHYSSEKFAPMEMCRYFTALGLESEFMDGEPDLNDL